MNRQRGARPDRARDLSAARARRDVRLARGSVDHEPRDPYHDQPPGYGYDGQPPAGYGPAPYVADQYRDDQYADGRYADEVYDDRGRYDGGAMHGGAVHGGTPHDRAPYGDGRGGGGGTIYGGGAVGAADGAPTPKRKRWKKILLISVLVLGLLGGGGAVAFGLYVRSIDKGIDRVDAFEQVPEETRPEKVAPKATNMLMLGRDTHNPDDSDSRTDSIILAHIPGDKSSAQLISIPRDTWLPIPKTSDGKGGRDAKINAAYAWGGVPLMVQTVEAYTGVRIDHVVLVDFAGFKEIVDALGGVDINVDRSFTSIHPPQRQFRKGKMHMDGATALDFSRQRKQFPDGDFTRIKHQQQMIRAVLDKAASSGLLTNPARLNAFVQATADTVTVDRTLSVLDMAMNLRHLRGDNVTFLTSPSKGTGRVGTESVVFGDPAKAKLVYDAIRRDAPPAEIAAAAK